VIRWILESCKYQGRDEELAEETMFEEERKIQILNILDRERSVTIGRLSEYFHVSASTIRRDLTSMEKAGLIKRTHGGAILVERLNDDLNFAQKRTKDYDLKNAIGKRAAELVKDGEVIAINSSTITMLMAEHLTARHLTIVTNSLNILNIIKECNDYQIVVLGGIYMANAQTIEGPTTTEQIKLLHFDKAFLGANGVDLEFGLSSASELEAKSKIAMIQQSKETYFLCEHKKFDRSSIFKVADLRDTTAVITDGQVDPEIVERYSKETDIIVAEV
jgi:DeoR family fructose operon transcriptional repressor